MAKSVKMLVNVNGLSARTVGGPYIHSDAEKDALLDEIINAPIGVKTVLCAPDWDNLTNGHASLLALTIATAPCYATEISDDLYVPSVPYGKNVYACGIRRQRTSTTLPGPAYSDQYAVTGDPVLGSYVEIATGTHIMQPHWMGGTVPKTLEFFADYNAWNAAVASCKSTAGGASSPVYAHIGWDEDGWYLDELQPYATSLQTTNLFATSMTQYAFVASGIEDTGTYTMCWTGSWEANRSRTVQYTHTQPPELQGTGQVQLRPYMNLPRATNNVECSTPFVHVTGIRSASSRNAKTHTYSVHYSDDSDNPVKTLVTGAMTHHVDRPSPLNIGQAGQYDNIYMFDCINIVPYDNTLLSFYRSGIGAAADPADGRWRLNGAAISYLPGQYLAYNVPMDVGSSTPVDPKPCVIEDATPGFDIPRAISVNVGSTTSGSMTSRFVDLSDTAVDPIDAFQFESIVGFIAKANRTSKVPTVSTIVT